MAKLFKIKNSTCWYYRVHVDGKDKWKSTRETDKKKALAVAEGHRAATVGTLNTEELFQMLLVRIDALPIDERDDKRLDYGQRLIRMQAKRLTFAEAWDRWLAMPNKSRFGTPKHNTLAGYAAIWKRCSTWATGQGLGFLNEMTQAQGEEYMGDVFASGVTERTYGAHLKFLRSFFNVLEKQAGIFVNPFGGNLTVPELQTQSREAFTPEELKTLCAAATGDWRYLIGIGIYTGLRLVDAVHLQWSDITASSITVVPVKMERRKKGKGRSLEIPLHSTLAELLKELRLLRGGNPLNYLFPELVKKYAKDRSDISVEFRQLLEGCGIVTQAGQTGEQRKRKASLRGFHSLRHSFVSMCAISGVPQATTQRLVGHSSNEITQLYSHAGKQAEEVKAINLLPSNIFV